MLKTEYFPDGVTPIDDWFYDARIPDCAELGTPYVLTDYGVKDNGQVYTEKIQQLIDTIAQNGGGVIVVPAGTYMTGSLFFRQGVNLYIEKDGVLMGSDDVTDYPVIETRIEGESCLYFAALINADGVDGFTMCGEGTVDGNGHRAWRAFWQRRKWNPACTNKDEQRPRLTFISHSKNVLVAGLTLKNSHFWTNHIYKSNHIKFVGCHIYSPARPVAAPSTDAIDIDACHDVLVKGCRIEVNDDAVVLKGGKGPYADTAPENGSNERILVEDCDYGFCHGCLTCGSESVHNRNVLVRRIKVHTAYNLLWLKLRPDTPQTYEHITVDDVQGDMTNFVFIRPWTQFFDLKGRTDKPLSVAKNVTVKNCRVTCKTYFNVQQADDQYVLSDFCFKNLEITAEDIGNSTDAVKNFTATNVKVNA